MKTLPLLVAFAAGHLGAAPPPGEPWLTGSRLQQRLDAPVSVAWQDAPLREAVARWSAAERLCVYIDRRVDPHQPLHLEVDGVPLRVALERMTDRLGLGTCLLGPVAYLGPRPAAERLVALSKSRRDEVKHLPRGRQAAFRRLAAWSWDDLATPRDLVNQLCREADVAIEALDRIPHDLWPRATLAPLPWTDRLTLVLIGFDLTFQIPSDARRVEIRSLEDVAELQTLPRENPQTRQRPAGGARPTKAENPRKRVHTFTVRNQSLETVLGELSRRLQLRIDVERHTLRHAGVSLDTLVSCDVKNATLDELLTQVLRPAGLAFQRQGNAVRIFVDEQP
jgi:hypothetical protein